MPSGTCIRAKFVCLLDYVGNFDEALQLYRAALRDNAGSEVEEAKIRSNLSATSAKLGDYTAAVAQATEVIRLQPAWHKGYLRKSHALNCLHQYKPASETLEQGLQRAKETADLLEAKHAQQKLLHTLPQSKKTKMDAAQQQTSSLEAALCQLQAAGTLLVMYCLSDCQHVCRPRLEA